MGDRRSIEIINTNDEGFKSQWFYTHWNGAEMAQALADSIRNNRSWWSENPNLPAVERSESFIALRADLSDSGTLSDYLDLIVDVGAQTVQEEGEDDPYVTDTVLSFDEFCNDPTVFSG